MSKNSLNLLPYTGSTGLLPSFANGLAERKAAKNSAGMVRATHQEILNDQCRAMLAASAMENVAMLSAFEMQCYRISPMGELRYAEIVNAYVAGAARRIARL